MGIPVITNPYLTMTKKVPRTLRERLFSWPWHPFRTHKYIQVPDDKIYVINTSGAYHRIGDVEIPAIRTYVCHPATFEKLKHEPDKQ